MEFPESTKAAIQKLMRLINELWIPPGNIVLRWAALSTWPLSHVMNLWYIEVLRSIESSLILLAYSNSLTGIQYGFIAALKSIWNNLNRYRFYLGTIVIGQCINILYVLKTETKSFIVALTEHAKVSKNDKRKWLRNLSIAALCFIENSSLLKRTRCLFKFCECSFDFRHVRES